MADSLYSIVKVSVAKLTLPPSTPSSLLTMRSMRAAQAEQLIPTIFIVVFFILSSPLFTHCFF